VEFIKLLRKARKEVVYWQEVGDEYMLKAAKANFGTVSRRFQKASAYVEDKIIE